MPVFSRGFAYAAVIPRGFTGLRQEVMVWTLLTCHQCYRTLNWLAKGDCGLGSLIRLRWCRVTTLDVARVTLGCADPAREHPPHFSSVSCCQLDFIDRRTPQVTISSCINRDASSVFITVDSQTLACCCSPRRAFPPSPIMPAFPQVNVSRVDVDQWQPPSTSQASPSTLQSLLFNILTVALAAATLVVACSHFMHQRKSKKDRHVIRGMCGRSS